MKSIAAVTGKVEAAAGALARRAMAHPHATLAVWLVVTLLPLAGLPSLRRDTDGQAMVPRSDPAIRRDRETRALFDLRDQIVIYFDTGRAGGIFDSATLAAVEQVSDRVLALPEIGRGHVMGLRTEARARLFPGWSETFRDFLTPLPASLRQLTDLEADLAHPAARLYTGTIVTADRSGTAILVGVPDHGQVDREEIYRRVANLVAPFRSERLAVDVVGAPVAEATLAAYILRDLVLLLPLSLLVIAVVVRLGTGRLAPVGLLLVKVSACIAFTFGVLGWLGWPVYLTVAIVPVVLAAMCIADELHVITRFQEALRRQDPDPAVDRRRALTETFAELALPVVAATFTTCLGFLSCLSSPIAPVQALGVSAAIGTFYSLLFTLTATPALLVLLPARFFAYPHQPRHRRRGALITWALRPRRGNVVVVGLLTLLAAAGAMRVEIQDGWLANFSRSDPLRQATERVNRSLFGVHRLEARLGFPSPGAFERPELLAALNQLEVVLRARADVGGVIGPFAQLAAVADFWNLGEAFRRGEKTSELQSRFDFAPGRVRRQRVLADGLSQGVMTIFLKGANFRDTARVMDAVEENHRRLLAAFGGTVSFAGDVAVSQAMIPAVVRSQVISLPLALGCVFLTVMVLCGSPRLALCAILPVAVSGLWLVGGLGFAGIPLGVASSMFFVLALGLGVDSHSIHLVMRFRSSPADPAAVLAEVRRPILVNTAAVAVGFGLLAFSNVPANRTLGLLIAIGLVLGCAITLTALAAVLVGPEKRTIGEKTPNPSAPSLSARRPS